MMKRILQLTTVLANQIAAGEVVERPASVVKELVENSLDANSTAVDIAIEGGGIHLIRVRDNGDGILKEDLPLAFARHATSKISTIADLSAIGSLGFRGEALASVASVSRCRLSSKTHDQQDAWQIQLASDMTSSIYPVAHTQGTTVEIADLFYNTPVRRKFIRSEKSEFQAIDDTVKRLALSYPAVSFRLMHQGRQSRYFPAVTMLGNEASRVAKICGQAFINQALFFELTGHGIALKGWLGKPDILRRQADCQYFFVNQRMVKDRLLNHVIKMVYQQQLGLPEGSYPCYVIYLTIDPTDVDVNVHPTKQEVRFSQPRHVHDFISKAVSETLGQRPVSAPVAPKIIPRERTRSLPFTAPLVSQVITIKACRYAFIEDEQGVIICDLVKGKKSLLQTYFLELWGSVPKQNVLFPLEIAIPSGFQTDKHAVTLLESLGFCIKIENQVLLLMMVPLVSTQANLSEIILGLLEQLMITQDKTTLCAWLAEQLPRESLQAIDNESYHWLLDTWRTTYPTAPWRRYSYHEFEQMLALPLAT